MTSARNHRLPLSGNKRLGWLCAALMMAAACAPKKHVVTTTVQQPVQQPKPTTVQQHAESRPARQQVQKTNTISLLLPFDLDKLSAAKGLSKADQRKANLAIDFYQGFKLGLDSLTAKGYNYKLQVFDSKDQPAQAHALAANATIRNSNLIVGPVFPEDLKAFATMPALQNKPVVSPLAPTPPSVYHNSGLITVAPPLEYHAHAAAQYLCRNMGAKKIFVLRSGYSDESKYAVPFQKAVDSIGRKKVKVVSFTVVRGNLTALLPQLSRTAENYFVVPGTNQAFLMVALHSLDTLNHHYSVVTFGHPNWIRYSFLHASLLQRLKTHITSADRIDYHSAETISFIKAYRGAYHHEPTEYAFKGFDEGLYFGDVLGENDNGLKRLDTYEFTGLHNGFHFEKKAGLGWVNTHVNLLKYANFELKQVE